MIKYLNCLILAVFVWVSIPVSFSHHLFANHHDDDHTECILNHKHLGIHIEKLESHCGLFDFDSPLYDAPRIVNFSASQIILPDEIILPETSNYSDSFYLTITARGPPSIA